jgi:hypothetical protein
VVNFKEWLVTVALFAVLALFVTVFYALSGPWGFHAGAWIGGGAVFLILFFMFNLVLGAVWALKRAGD